MGKLPDIAIPSATSADAEPLARLVTELGYPTGVGQMRQRLEGILRDDQCSTLVACEDGEVVGFVGVRVGPTSENDEQYGQIMALSVAPDHPRRGIGRRLMQAAESRLVERGAAILIVTSGNHRAQAHAFYECCGYTFTGRRYKKSARQMS